MKKDGIELITNISLTNKLKKIDTISVEVKRGMIFGVCEDDELIPMSQEIFEVVATALIGSNGKILEALGRKFKITAEEIQ